MLGTLGDLIQDVVVRRSGPIERATDTPAVIVHRRGGSAANTAATAARLTGRSVFIGQIGADEVGDWLAARLAAAGVLVRGRRGGHSGTVVALVDPDGERSMLTDRGSCADLTDPDPVWLDGLGALHVPFYSFAVEPLASTAVELVHRATGSGIAVSIDASSTAVMRSYGLDRFVALLRSVAPDVLLCNEDEAGLLGDLAVPDALGARCVVVKQGPRPALVRTTGGESAVPVPPLAGDVHDTTGAGDAFAAGFLLARLRGADDVSAAAAGHRAAAAVLAGGDRVQ